jgi:hypothetical protein
LEIWKYALYSISRSNDRLWNVEGLLLANNMMNSIEIILREVPNIEKRRGKKDANKKPSIVVYD